VETLVQYYQRFVLKMNTGDRKMRRAILLEIILGLLVAITICLYIVALVASAYFIQIILFWDFYLMLLSATIATGTALLGAILQDCCKYLWDKLEL
jgi:hypothetical protein